MAHSKMFAKVKKWYDELIWTLTMVKNAVLKKKITSDEYHEITGEDFPEK